MSHYDHLPVKSCIPGFTIVHVCCMLVNHCVKQRSIFWLSEVRQFVLPSDFLLENESALRSPSHERYWVRNLAELTICTWSISIFLFGNILFEYSFDNSGLCMCVWWGLGDQLLEFSKIDLISSIPDMRSWAKWRGIVSVQLCVSYQKYYTPNPKFHLLN